jgi:RHS repeat-associated protein
VDGLLLTRQASDPWQDGYNLYLSEEVVAVADLRAARAYTRTSRESEACVRCNGSQLGVASAARELLSGDTVRVRLPETLATALGTPVELLSEATLELPSVRWETAPSLRQEPTLNPSYGSGDVVPGTLLHSGEFTTAATDLFVGGRGLDFAFTRTYRSQTVGSGPLGPGWDHGYNQWLRELPTGDVEYYDGRGRREVFILAEDGTLEAPPGRFVELTRTSAGWILIGPHNDKLRFDRWGRLVQIADAVKRSAETGNEMTFAYDWPSRLVRIEDSLGRRYHLEYDEAGRLTAVSDFTGRKVTYGYDAAGRLTTVTSPAVTIGESVFPAGLTTTYGYATPVGDLAGRLNSRDNLTSITDPKGQKWLELTYTDADGDGRAEEVTGQTWGGDPLSIGYTFGEAGTETAVTDRRSFVTSYAHDAEGRVVEINDPVTAVTRLAYDEEGLLTQRTAPLGRVTTTTYDTTGARRSRGNTIRVEVTPDARGPNGSSPTLVTTVAYDSRTNLPTRIVDPRGAVTEIVRDDSGLPSKETRALGAPEEASTTYAYNAHGQLEVVTNPIGNVTRYDYFAQGPSTGYLQKVTVDPGGLAITTANETDTRGNVTATIDPRGVRHESRYNELDWVVQTRAAVTGSTDGAPALGYTTKYLYDANGNQTETWSPHGDSGEAFVKSFTTYGLLDEVSSAAREVTPGGERVTTRFEYDEGLNRVRVTDPGGHVTRTEYDSRGLPESVTYGSGTAVSVTESFTYDLDRAQRAHTDGRSHTRTTHYDGFGRVLERLDALGHRTTTTYDDAGNVRETHRYDAGGTLLARSGSDFDLLGRRTASKRYLWASDPGLATEVSTTTVYDKVGNVEKVIEPYSGGLRESRFEYDAAGRQWASVDPLGNRIERTLDAAGNTTATTVFEVLPEGGTAAVTASARYDALGRRTQARDAFANTTRSGYDAAGNLRFLTDPELHVTVSTYDGLGRVTSTTRPGGIWVEHEYTADSQQRVYRDALGNETVWSHDPLHRVQLVTYPDQRTKQYDYDGAGNVVTMIDQRGTTVSQVFDEENRLTSRTVAPATGQTLAGPLTETYAYDGLGRLTGASSGSVSTELAYDSLSRVTRETTGGRSVEYQLDAPGNPSRIVYPSGLELAQGFDALDRPESIGTAATYAYRGQGRVAGKSLGNGITGTVAFDAAGRLGSARFEGSEGATVLSEALSWSPRGLKTATARGDRNDRGAVFAYDPAGRLVVSAEVGDPLALAPNNTATSAVTLASLPERVGFSYDQAENLRSRARAEDEVVTSEVSFPLDGSGRNRPGAMDGTTLDWDANGNLVQKGNLTFEYDFRDRLTRVINGTGDQVASYSYDAFNRRVAKAVNGVTEQTVWSGWRPLEEYTDGQLSERRTYGLAIDELVRVESDLTGDGTLETVLQPVYDSSGNIALVTGSDGRILERYDNDPYGERKIYVDLTAPRVEQLRVVGDEIWLEISEEVMAEALAKAVEEDALTVVEVATETPVSIAALSQPIREGRQAGRRLVLALAAPPAAGTELELTIPATSLRDSFGNVATDAFVQSFAWPDGGAVLFDQAPPRVESVVVRSGYLEVELSEEADAAGAAAEIQVAGQEVGWGLEADRYTLRSDAALPPGNHQLTIGTGSLDLAGQGLTEPFELLVAVGANDSIAYQAPDEREVETSSVGNGFGFHGRSYDAETGLMYFRNRYFDPEMGRFVTADPLGYVDGPSQYGFAGNDPVNSGDPLGLYETDVHFYAMYYLARVAGFSAREAREIGFASQYVDDDPYSEPFLNTAKFFRPARDRVRALHFASPYSLPVEENNIYARAAAVTAGRSGNLTRLGIALHTFADSFSHAGFSLDWDSSENRRAGKWFRPNMGHADTEHGGHQPDLPYLYPEKAMRMARAALEVLQDAFRHVHAETPPPVDNRLDSDLWSLFTYATDEKELRSARWRGLIWVRLGEDITYPTGPRPTGWHQQIDQQVETVRSFTTFSATPYSILDLP